MNDNLISNNIQKLQNMNTNLQLNSPNFHYDLEFISSQQKQKLNLDEILEAIKNLKNNSAIADELRIAIKIIKKYKLTECSKWNSELLISVNSLNFNEKDKSKFDLNSSNNKENPNIKNLNLIFNKHEAFNFSSIVLNSDRESMSSNLNFNNENDNITPNNYNPHIFNNSDKNKFTSIPTNKNNPTNRFQMMYNKLKFDEEKIKDVISYAASLFDLNEFVKCTFILKNYATPKYPTAMFLYYYSEYMIIQQRKQEDLIENSDLGSKYYSSSELSKLYQILVNYENKNEMCPFMLYLYGIILKDLKMLNEAKIIFIRCLNQFPFLWPAWVELALITKQNEIVNILFLYFRN